MVSLRGQEDALLFPGVSGFPDDSISVLLESSAQGASFRHPSSVDLDVEPYLSWPQVDTHTPGSMENVSYVSDLLQLPKRKDDSVSFRNVSKQLLSTEAVARGSSSLPPSQSVFHWPRETNSNIRGSENVKVLKQHKGSLQVHHKGMVGPKRFSLPLNIGYFLHRRTVFTIMLSSLLHRCWMLTTTGWAQLKPLSPLRHRSSRPLSPLSEVS